MARVLCLSLTPPDRAIPSDPLALKYDIWDADVQQWIFHLSTTNLLANQRFMNQSFATRNEIEDLCSYF